MELKNLLTKLKNKEEAPEYFFALEINDDSIKSAIWTVDDGHTEVVAIGSINSWDGKNTETLLNSIDQSISLASKNINQDPSGVIFGLPETWIEKENISDIKKLTLKKICQDLELKPLGFVVTDTAVIKYLRIEEGTPPSAIFLRLTDSEINLSLVKLGKIIGVELVGRSGDLGPDVEEGLSRFENIDTLPSRMILYDGKKDFEEDKQQLISYDWEEKLPFIHFPKVESLPQDASIKAVALAGGSEVAKSLGFEIKPPKSTPSQPNAASIGFVSEDIAKKIKAKKDPEPKSTPAQPETISPSENTTQSVIKTSPLQLIKEKIYSIISNFKPFLKTKKTPKALTIIIGIFISIFLGLLSAYWYLPRANISLYVEPKAIDESLTLTIDSNITTLDPEKGILPGESVDIAVEGSKSISTTGTSLVGDLARGEITIYNKTDSPKTFPAGSILIGPDNLSFSLDEDTTVASSSAVDGGIAFGKAIGKITANSIGPDGNLPAETNISFKQYSDDNYSAKTTNSLSGGTAREVKAVSKEDQDNLLQALTLDLKNQAATSLKEKLGGDRSLVDVENQEDLISKIFSHDLDEEADNLTLNASLKYSALSYRQNDLDLLLQQAIKEKIPSNYEISQSSEIEIAPATLNKNKTATIDVSFKAKLVPKLNFSDIKNNLKGKYPKVIQEYLATIPGFIKADITVTPNLPDKLKTLPRITKNIIIELKTQ